MSLLGLFRIGLGIVILLMLCSSLVSFVLCISGLGSLSWWVRVIISV